MNAIRFQSTPRRELPCYGNLELPFKIKQENATSPQFFPSIGKSIQTETDKVSEVKVKEERREREKDREREKERERERDREKERDRDNRDR